ncbi:hypothetical protein ACJIZ3_014434 [Penstemon smallii]|uniref:Transmembrane protein 53 n=1 Tax=Penstemon smallii TaxID=265156 RepID=A0ABD3RMZ9_9LAMI
MATARIFLSSSRHFPNSLILRNNSIFHLYFPQTKQSLNSPFHRHFPTLSLHHSQPKINTFPISPTTRFSPPHNFLHRVFFGLDRNTFHWNYASFPVTLNNGDEIVAFDDDKGPEVAVVLLGWLGAKRKHLRRYVELYNERGIHAVTFVASVMDVLSFDLGKKLEEKIERLSRELVSWLSSNEGGRERFLIFHTFSNTGWLAYGAILDNMKGRQDLLEKIKGCVVDSGGDPNLDPKGIWRNLVRSENELKVWAAGFTTALLKKSSSATYPSSNEPERELELGNGINGSKTEEKEPIFIETLLLFTFEKLFSYLLNLPDINRRLTKILSALSTSQPPCPQLYLYSTGDKVIPFRAVESFIDDQMRKGKRVISFNFGSSPHVDHYRTFPDVYSTQLQDFLKECLVMGRKL